MDINSYSDFRQTRTTAFNFCRWMLKWGSFVWHPKTMSIAHVPKDNARPSSTCQGTVWKYTLHPSVQEIPFKERGWQEIVGKDFFKESYGRASPSPRLQWEGGRAAAPFLELVSEAVAELERIKSDTAIRDTGVDRGMKNVHELKRNSPWQGCARDVTAFPLMAGQRSKGCGTLRPGVEPAAGFSEMEIYTEVFCQERGRGQTGTIEWPTFNPGGARVDLSARWGGSEKQPPSPSHCRLEADPGRQGEASIWMKFGGFMSLDPYPFNKMRLFLWPKWLEECF